MNRIKLLYVFIPIFLCLQGYAQIANKPEKVYSTVQVVGFSNQHATAGGAHVSFGAHSKGLGIGPGVGLLILGTSAPYIPLYLNFLYAGGKNKLSPMCNFRIGKGFYKGSAEFIGENTYVKAGFYADAVGGLAIKFNKAKIHLFGGITLMSFSTGYESGIFHESIFNAGIGFFTIN